MPSQDARKCREYIKLYGLNVKQPVVDFGIRRETVQQNVVDCCMKIFAKKSRIANKNSCLPRFHFHDTGLR